MRPTAVIAGNIREFWHKMQGLIPEPKKVNKAIGSVLDQNDKLYFYVSRPSQLRGFSDFDLLKIGTYWTIDEMDLAEIDEIHKRKVLCRRSEPMKSYET